MVNAPKRILVVEDNADNREILTMELEFQGYQVATAEDGEEAVEKALDGAPDLIVMDMSLPTMSGLEATRRIKAHPRTAHIPVVALTAHAMDDDEARFRNAGCDYYIAKPIDPESVALNVNRILEKG
jgi:two-component system, cell cycle response regulator DivK